MCLKSLNDDAPDQEQNVDHVVPSVTRKEDTLCDPCMWLLQSLILHGYIEGITSVEDLNQSINREFYIKPSSADEPV